MARDNGKITNSDHFGYVLSGGAFPVDLLAASDDGVTACRSIILNADGDITIKRLSDGASVALTAWPKGVRLPVQATEITTCTVNALVLW